MTCERWFLITTKGLSRGDAEAAGAMIEITRADVLALDLVPCGGRDVRGVPQETYFVYRGDPDGDNDWKLS